jgi:predicted DNA-binding transcriptional regulator YafY
VLPPSARWVAEAYAPQSVDELDDGRLRVRLLASGERWLERLLLRVGPEAVVESPSAMAGVGARAAARLLAAYEA